MKKQSGKKLVEILAVELKEWPEGFNGVGQAADGSLHLPGVGGHVRHSLERYTLSSDWSNAIVTREMWEAERAKLSKPKANAQGWIRHRGGKQPVADGVRVDYRMRNGRHGINERSELLDWGRSDESPKSDIMAYRLHQPEQPAEPVEVEAGGPEVTAQNDGPLQWRDRITEIDRAVEALEEERASLIQRLADEGFKLI